MTQSEFDKKVKMAVQARKVIKEMRDAGLIKDSYQVIFNAALNGIEKRLINAKIEGK